MSECVCMYGWGVFCSEMTHHDSPQVEHSGSSLDASSPGGDSQGEAKNNRSVGSATAAEASLHKQTES